MYGKYAAIASVLSIAFYISSTIDFLDFSKVVVLHHNENCEKVSIEMPSEDLAQFGNFLIGAMADSPSLYYKHLSASQAPAGSLIGINPSTHEVFKIKTHDFPSKYQMNPHGITLVNNKTLYVLSHSYHKGGEIVFLFDITEKDSTIEATYKSSIKISDDHGNYNGIAVVDPTHFYITQWIPFPDTAEGRDNSFFTSLYRTFLFSYTKTNGVKLCTVTGENAICDFKARGYIPNGIVFNGEKLLFFADSAGKSVEVYEIAEDFNLNKKQSIPIGHITDNLYFHDGVAYVTGITRLIDYILFSESVKNNEPWHFVPGGTSKITYENGKWVSREVFMQDLISLPSSTFFIGDQSITSSIIDNSIVFCKFSN